MSDTPENLLNEIITSLKKRAHSLENSLWLKHLKIHAIDEEENHIYLSTENELQKEKIINRYLKEIRSFLKQRFPKIQISVLSPRDFAINTSLQNLPVFSSQKNSPTPTNETIPPKSPPPSESYLPLHPSHSFKRFVVTEANRVAYDFSQKIIASLGSISPIYLYGPVGCGKTHLIQSIGGHLLSNFPFLKMAYLDPNEFVSEFTRAISLGTDRSFRLKYKSLDVLLIDDIQFFMGKEKTGIEFFQIFNAIYAPGKKQMVFCSDREPSELNKIDERLKSRLSSAAVIEIKPPSIVDKKAIVLFYAQENKLTLCQKVVDFLANNLPSDIRQIVGALSTLTVFNSLYQKPINIDFCVQNIKQLTHKNIKGSMSAETLVVSLTNQANITLSQLKSKIRTSHIAFYRQIAMYLLREYSGLSILEIGNYLGGLTPSTVSIACKKIREKLKTTPPLQKKVQQILSQA